MTRPISFLDKRIFIVLLFLVGSAFGYIRHNNEKPNLDPFSGTVVSVADGDTVTVEQDNGDRRKVRLYGIDSPELHQPYGKDARKFTDELLYRKHVDVFPQDKDRYSRMVALVKMDQRIINEEIVGAGYAWWFKRYAPTYKELRDLELNARKESLGLWRDPNPTPPWDWRNAHRHKDWN